MHRFFASCGRGLEELLATELRAAGIADARPTAGGAQFGGDIGQAYRACLWSRIASRVLVVLGEVAARDATELHAGVVAMEWERHVPSGASIAVDFIGTSDELRNTLFSARLLKDGIVDRLRAVAGWRPDVDVRDPGVRIVARLHRDRVTVSIDVGGTLHERGYRSGTGAAPLKENLASAVLLRAGWPEVAAAGGALYDPLCGAGTLLIEGAMIAAGAAPGERRRVGDGKWPAHDAALWSRMVDEARVARVAGTPGLPPIAGADDDARVLERAAANAKAAGFGESIAFARVALERQARPDAMRERDGLLVCNPPYGERLGRADALHALYADLGRLIRDEFPGWRAAILTVDAFADSIGLPFARRHALRNGPLDVRLLVHDPVRRAQRIARAETRRAEAAAAPDLPVELSEGARMFANRVRKNLQRLKGWLSQTQPACYRLYDADIPEYAVAVDRYGDWLHVAEYAPPATIDAAVARARLDDVRAALQQELRVPADRIVLKTRERQRGNRQYERIARDNNFMEVREGPARLLVNLRDFLDTGLFLDHRPARRMIGELARGARFLNLFCYTAAVTVHAALGGAVDSTSVDMSQTYLDWAGRNLALNGIDARRHRCVRADCLRWMEEQRGRWDLIFLDPPSFSNSKRMDGTLDVQRDHVRLIQSAMRLLAPDGVLLFSTNRRGFRLDAESLGDIEIADLSADSVDPDFGRARLPHRLFRLRHPC